MREMEKLLGQIRKFRPAARSFSVAGAKSVVLLI
jgi:hypothetical protein